MRRMRQGLHDQESLAKEGEALLSELSKSGMTKCRQLSRTLAVENVRTVAEPDEGRTLLLDVRYEGVPPSWGDRARHPDQGGRLGAGRRGGRCSPGRGLLGRGDQRRFAGGAVVGLPA